ncbi:MAG: major facilitator superfamily 1 [Frankiales bacterium]|nr:major facilitator superfamily 1 [Frankiales bacterium]
MTATAGAGSSPALTRGYGPLLRTPGAAAFTWAAAVGRLPIAMLGIGTVLLVEDRRGSYALAGLVSAAYALGLAVLAPLISRAVDRRGQRVVLPFALGLSTLGVFALVLLAGTQAPAGWLVAAAAVMSASSSQLGSCVRSRWSDLLTAADRQGDIAKAYAWESVVDEVVFVFGPLVVVTCALLDPAVGLALAALLGAIGTLALVAQRSTEPPVRSASGGRHPSALVSPGLRTLTVSMLFVGVLFGTVEVSMVAFAEERGSAAAGGLLLALVAGGSAAAGLGYGLVHWAAPLHRRFLIALVGLAFGLVPMTFAPSVALMAPAALLAGIAISPSLIGAFGLVDPLVPPAARTEGFSWLNSGLGVGVAAGFAASGAVADSSSARTALLVALGGAVAAAAVGFAFRRTLVPRDAV